MDENAKNNLKQLMQSISQDGYCASWMMDLEHNIWNAVVAGPRAYGRTDIDQDIIEKLKELSQKANGWWVYDKQYTEHKFLKLDEWREYYAPECADFKFAEVIDDIKGASHTSHDNIYLVYDGVCPICTHAARELRIAIDGIKLVKINAKRQNDHPILNAVLKPKGINLADGMVSFYKKQIFLQKAVWEFFEEHGAQMKVFREHPHHSYT